MSGKLTTHVLDTAYGCPAANMALELWSIHPDYEQLTLLKITRTNAMGRTDDPLLNEDEFEIGIYELIFSVGDYFRVQSPSLPQPLFLDRVPIRFGVADATAHYHIPLLVSPWSYSTYRGS